MRLSKAKHSKLMTSFHVMIWEKVGGSKVKGWSSCWFAFYSNTNALTHEESCVNMCTLGLFYTRVLVTQRTLCMCKHMILFGLKAPGRQIRVRHSGTKVLNESVCVAG